jgi:DNA helicase-2/ATP-dependent DNA helicase PcrA
VHDPLREAAADEAIHSVVREELAPSEDNLVRELEVIRDQLLRGKLDFYERSALSTRWNVQTTLLKRLRENRAAPKVDPGSPYFAHLRLKEAGRTREVCIGRATRLSNGLRIVDWRHAPIARIFYRYRQDEEFEEEVSGKLRTGLVLARRTVAIRDARLERVDAPEGSFVVSDPRDASAPHWSRLASSEARLAGGEGVALRFHNEKSGGERRLGTDASGKEQRLDRRLPDIAGLIDPEQFALIAKPSAGFVAIRGAAGSGKTTVALHRIAYLAYEDARVDSEETLFVVFSRALRDYVAHVLPALGVPRAKISTFQEWAADKRHALYRDLPTTPRDDTPAYVQRLKLHPLLGQALEDHVRDHQGPATPAQAFDDWASVLSNEERLLRLFGTSQEGLSPDRLRDACRWSRARYEELCAHLAGDRDQDAALDPEDDALLLRAWQLRVGPIPGERGEALRYRHVAIDEVQDFSPNEVRVLLDCIDEHKSLTLAGDTQQHIVQGSGFTSWESFFTNLGIGGTEISTLQVSYRSSRPITEFSLAVLGEARDPDSQVTTTREGPAVECFQFTDEGACVAFLSEALIALGDEEPLASIALLTPSPETSELYWRGLSQSEVPRLRHVKEQDFRFSPGIEITEIEQAKGLEFDYVILLDADDLNFPDSLAHRRLLHVGATRAIHQLWLMHTSPVSPIVASAMASARSGNARSGERA